MGDEAPRFFERVTIGVAAADGLLTAACITGLPAASCTALVETYVRAIGTFEPQQVLHCSARHRLWFCP